MTEIAVYGYTYTVISLLLVNISVFGHEVGLLTVPKRFDWVVTSFLIAATVFFIVDMLLLCHICSDYFLSSMFGLDLVSVVSLLPDIPVISNFTAYQVSIPSADVAVPISRFAASAAGTGTRFTKSIRVLRVLREIRLVGTILLFPIRHSTPIFR
jgi:hypothetical protein